LILGKEERIWRMQKKQSKSLRRNIGKIWKIWQGKNMRKERLEEESYQEDLRQENYSDGQTRDMTKNTREDWKGIGDDGRARDPRKEKQ